MRSSWCLLSLVLWTTSTVSGGQTTAAAASSRWKVTADSSQETIALSYGDLGVVLNEVRLYSQPSQRSIPMRRWSVDAQTEGVIRIHTTDPESGWSFEADGDNLKISCTTASGMIVGEAPAPKDRIVARTLDKAGVPVKWTGTEEVANGYDGAETLNPSFLPRENPEVMYFALGQVSGTGFHALFDRKTDTVVDFSREARMNRAGDQSDQLQVTIPIPGNALVEVTRDYYKGILGVPYYSPFNETNFPSAPVVWSSWTSYYAEVTEKDIVQNAEWIATNLKPYGFQYVQLDDGYDRGKAGEHYWIENWDRTKFPHGPQWLTEQIKAHGLKAGIWLVPNAYAGAVDQHPDWYVRNKQGKFILDYKTPTLDSTNPEVLGFVKKLFKTLDGWGFEYYKFDGEHAFSKYVPAVDQSKLHDRETDPLVLYRDRLKLIREVVGPKVFIEGCPAGTPLNGIGYFNSYFNGDDVYNSWQGMYPLFSSINANAFLNHLLIYVMPGEGMEVGPSMTVAEASTRRNQTFMEVARSRETPLAGFGTTLPEARTLASYVALTGVVYPLASVLPELPQERIRVLKMTLPTMPILPIDLFSRGTDMRWDKFKHERPDTYIHNYPEILDLKVAAAAGSYDVVGLTNWRSGTLHKQLSFAEKLGVSPEESYTVFDYWQQKLLGEFKGRVDVDIEPHDTRVLLVRPVLNRPQLVGDSRHITGAYSIRSLAWEGNRNVLAGSSQTVAGEPYTMTFLIPAGFSLAQVSAVTEGREIQVEHRLVGHSLSVSFEGQPTATQWKLEFARSKQG